MKQWQRRRVLDGNSAGCLFRSVSRKVSRRQAGLTLAQAAEMRYEMLLEDSMQGSCAVSFAESSYACRS